MDAGWAMGRSAVACRRCLILLFSTRSICPSFISFSKGSVLLSVESFFLAHLPQFQASLAFPPQARLGDLFSQVKAPASVDPSCTRRLCHRGQGMPSCNHCLGGTVGALGIHSLFKKSWETRACHFCSSECLMMPKHRHMLRVLLGAQQNDVQCENLTTRVSSLCCTMCDNRAMMQSLSMKKITISCLSKIKSKSAHDFEFTELQNAVNSPPAICSLMSQVESQTTLQH